MLQRVYKRSKRTTTVFVTFLSNFVASAVSGSAAPLQLFRIRLPLFCCQNLVIHDNRLEKLPNLVGLLTSLTILDVDNNCLEELPVSLGLLTTITVIPFPLHAVEFRNRILEWSATTGWGFQRLVGSTRPTCSTTSDDLWRLLGPPPGVSRKLVPRMAASDVLAVSLTTPHRTTY